MKKPPRLALVASANLAILIVMLLAVEWGYRQLRPTTVGPKLGMATSHPTRIWSYKPNYETTFATKEFSIDIRTNSRGLRSAENLEGEITVLAIGDSFTFGWGVNRAERFSLETAVDESFNCR